MPALKTVLARNALLCGTAAALCLLLPPAFAQEPIATPILQSDPNFRDLAGIAAQYGGTGYADTTGNGGAMRTGVFYRSNGAVAAQYRGFPTLSSSHIVLDIDLRTPAEIYNHPNVPRPNGTDPTVCRLEPPMLMSASSATLRPPLFGSTDPHNPIHKAS